MSWTPQTSPGQYPAAGGLGMRRRMVCGASLEGRRRQTLTCSASCRREAARVRAILAGAGAAGYGTVGHSDPSFTLRTYVHLLDDDLGEPLGAPRGVSEVSAAPTPLDATALSQTEPVAA